MNNMSVLTQPTRPATAPSSPVRRRAKPPLRGTADRRDGGAEPRGVRVILADPDVLTRRLLRDELQAADGFVVIADARTGREAIELARFYTPDVILVEARLHDPDGVATTAQIVAVAPGSRVVMLSWEDDPELVLRALRAGASGFLPKDIEPASLPRVLRRVVDGETAVPRRFLTPLVSVLRRLPDRGYRPLRSRLTAREWEIIELLGEGSKTEDIADRLVLSQATVYTHIKHVMRKLGVSSRAEAVAAAERLRHVELGLDE